jgi:ABC-type glycerol-3-phosphate transport system substrate-binding protein
MRRSLLLVMVALILTAAAATAAPAFAGPPDTEKARELCIKQYEADHSWPPWCADLFLAG